MLSEIEKAMKEVWDDEKLAPDTLYLSWYGAKRLARLTMTKRQYRRWLGSMKEYRRRNPHPWDA